ncbi:MAG: bifunctional diaminohydroxyphosphoribosylaminopyrimidine deaminase/5-amino-6-(5-phosphoribosylamino)uracil reductase RibD [Wenzhouxiangellaceae bacterium]|nr:bifunctional diaminohydroxyphosphoribosylaminopyrimidine deaminase/5-amino-6-(5-phosphoribosylamino)uracil reductase RibD [Wenzhouxiangellaceae bacterium]
MPGTGFDGVDHAMMAEALRLARRGLYTTEPNPRVGCVIARGADVVGRGWHEKAGQAHAEVAALGQAGEAARGASAFVTLEPCNFQGRTPPCVDALRRAGIYEVVCAMPDPHPRVAGAGMEQLRNSGIRVRCGLMESQARELNPGFISRFERGRPWLRAKLAASLDGRSIGPDGSSQWITGQAARTDGHRWRARAGAILTGIGTLLADDPRLDVRLDGFRKTPLVVVLDSQARLPHSARLLRTGARVIQVCRADAPASAGSFERLELPSDESGRIRLDLLLQALADYEVNELHVEAGSTLTGALLAAGHVDELLVYQAPCLIGGRGGAMLSLPGVEKLDQRLHLELLESRRVGCDQRLRFAPSVV